MIIEDFAKQDNVSMLKIVKLNKDFSSIDFELEDDKDDYLSSIERLKNKIS